MLFRRFVMLVAVGAMMCSESVPAQGTAAVTDEVQITGKYLNWVIVPWGGARVDECVIRATGHDVATGDGLLLEGFGVGSQYVPSRRLNEKMIVLQQVKDRPVLQYTYDCDGPNIKGLRVTRTMEVLPNESSLLVRWKLENKGAQDLWVSPWVRSVTAPGGGAQPTDRIDAPTLTGVRRLEWSGYHPAARNWFAATDPATKETVYGVFNADHLHSVLALVDSDQEYGLQAAFVPRMFKPGDGWETTYRLNVARGLTHIDFAAEELAVQFDYLKGKLEVRLAAVKALPQMQIEASIRASNERVWKLPAKQFTATPEKVVVCSYDWEPPADGAYDFMARLSVDGTTYELSRNLATPHGGIDTQFVVGTPKTVAFEPWTNAPEALQRGARRLKRTLAAPGNTAIWFENSLEKVFRQDVVEPAGTTDSTVRVSLARNEHESFQVAIRPPANTSLTNVAFRVGDLRNAKGGAIPASNVTVHNVRYHAVRIPTHFEGPTGEWPDALPPFQPFTARGGETSVVWFTLYAPPGIPAGAYVGPIEMSTGSGETYAFQLEARVFDFELPVAPTLKTDFGFWQEGALQWCRQMGYKGTDGALAAAYMQNALAHRVTLRQPAQLPSESANYANDLQAFELRFKELEARGATTYSVPATLLDTPAQLKLANDFVVRNQLQNRAFCQMADEPGSPSWPRLSERMQQWQAAAPDIPMMVTTTGLEAFLPDLGRIWAVHLQMLDTLNNTPILERIREGGEVWTYVNEFPPRPYGNFFIDFQGIEHRILFWQAWALGMKGFHYWNINYVAPGQSPYQSLLDITPTNGDGFLVYPGAEGPVSSIRWENIRDGLEDHDYLVILRERAVRLGKANPQVSKAFDLGALNPNLVGFPRDPRVLLNKREEIATAIESLGRNAR